MEQPHAPVADEDDFLLDAANLAIDQMPDGPNDALNRQIPHRVHLRLQHLPTYQHRNPVQDFEKDSKEETLSESE